MVTRIELPTKLQHPAYGDFLAGLWVTEGSTSDDERNLPQINTVRARDMLLAMPILQWHSAESEPDGLRDALTFLQAKALDAVESLGSVMPATLHPTVGVRFEIVGSTLRLTSSGRPLGLLGEVTFKINERLAWFLERGRTLGVQILGATKSWVATVSLDETAPQFAVVKGSTSSKAFKSLVEHSLGWRFVHLGNPSLFPDASNVGDHHCRTFSANPLEADLPNLDYRGRCLGCGSTERSREHCVPNWVARENGVMPVVAEVFCHDCNQYFGNTLEVPISGHMRRRTLQSALSNNLFARWAIKTALALSAAADVRVEDRWMHDLRRDEIPPGFEVFASSDVRMEPGYIYTVTYFSEIERQNGLFLATFATHGIAFGVVRNDPHLEAIPGLPRTYPDVQPAESVPTMQIDFPELHLELLTRMTGERLTFTPSQMRPAAPRQARTSR